ncbi:MAG: hypothetical protein E7667_03600 [Ruminococcaceae bacterium]|nr:hypothetical protein [Oscillospiraceae bacterium]
MPHKGRYIICPFFKSQGSLVIKCEGVLGTKTTALHFDTPTEKTVYRRTHCESFNYEKTCDVCRQILKKYHETEAQKPRQMLIIS